MSTLATLLLTFVGLATVIIFTKKNATHLRFMYPGLVTFLVFMVIPIFFSIYISTTNLGTGHFFSKEDATTLILQERIFDNSSPVLQFEMYKSTSPSEDKKYLIQTENSSATFNLTDTKIQLEDVRHKTVYDWKQLSTGEIYSIKDQLSKINFKTLSGHILSYYRTDKLAKTTQRYNKQGEDLVDTVTGTLYAPNDDQGFYYNKATNNRLSPGFYTFIGLDNYISIFQSETIKSSFLKVCTWTLIWAFMSVFLSFSAGMFLALFLNDKNLTLKPLYRSLIIIPYSIPFFISVLVFKGMLNKDYGLINDLISNLGLAKVDWLNDPFMAKISALLVNLWLGFPYMFLLITGILQSIPQSVYEAAKLDGASKWTTFRKITLPLIMSSIAPLIIGSFAFNLNNFVGIYLLTGGGPPIPGAVTPVGETDILISYTYRLAFEGAGGQFFGLASTISLFIFVIISALTVINFKVSKINKEAL
jgi:maltose/maltodextrin transport system permease protein